MKGDLARFDADNRSLKSQLNEAKDEIGTATVKAVFEYQSSVEMAILNRPFGDEAYKEATKLIHIYYSGSAVGLRPFLFGRSFGYPNRGVAC